MGGVRETNRVVIPTGCVALVVVPLEAAECCWIKVFFATDHCVTRSIRNCEEADQPLITRVRGIVVNDCSCLVEIASRVISLGVTVSPTRSVPRPLTENPGLASLRAEEGLDWSADSLNLAVSNSGLACSTEHIVLFEIRENLKEPARLLPAECQRLSWARVAGRVGPVRTAVWEEAKHIVVGMDCDSDLLQVVRALEAGCGFANLLLQATATQ